jgi:hypothetical protein
MLFLPSSNTASRSGFISLPIPHSPCSFPCAWPKWHYVPAWGPLVASQMPPPAGPASIARARLFRGHAPRFVIIGPFLSLSRGGPKVAPAEIGLLTVTAGTFFGIGISRQDQVSHKPSHRDRRMSIAFLAHKSPLKTAPRSAKMQPENIRGTKAGAEKGSARRAGRRSIAALIERYL